MGQHQIDKLRAARAELDLYEAQHRELKRRLRGVIDRLVDACDHKYANGTSAMDAGFVEDVCLICRKGTGV